MGRGKLLSMTLMRVVGVVRFRYVDIGIFLSYALADPLIKLIPR